ncbi:MAG TPA: hypothetical protein VFN61_16810 [Acidimicrobiales bacterium]|nr:hypothetical protein [Acidimicrobiales bacterium]
MPEGVRDDRLVDPGAARHPADEASGLVAVNALAIGAQEEGAGGPLTDGQVDRPGRARRQRHGYHLAPLANDSERAMAALHAQGLDVGTEGSGDAQPVQSKQRDKGMLDGWAEPGGDQQRAHLVPVEADGVALVAQAGAADVYRWGRADQALLFGVAVEAGHGAEPARHGGPGLCNSRRDPA